MGAIFSNGSHFQESFKKNQEYISEMNRIKMERWIQMHYMMKQRETALKIAKDRELFLWVGSFSVVTATGIVQRYIRTKRSAVLAPLIPLAFVFAYYGDLAYGNKLSRIHAEAEMIINHENALLEWPCGLPTVSEIDSARIDTEENVFLHPHQQ